jgi:hypothetical protein
MSSVQARPTVESLLSGEIAIDQPAAIERLKALFASIFPRRLRTQQQAMPGDEGRGWSDSTERGILDDIALSQARRALF